MTAVFCAAVLQSALMIAGVETAAGDETYAEAHRVTVETGKPLVVMIGTDWCRPCQTMKRMVLPRIRKRRFFKKIAFAIVNPDQDHELAEALTDGGPVPQLVMYRKTADGWMRRKLVGGHSEEDVEQFIEDGLAADKAEKQAAGEQDDLSS